MTKSTMSVFGIYGEPNIPDCTDQAGADTLNLPPDASVNNIACTAGAVAQGGFSGHINWFPITLEGNAGAAEHNTDDDWSLSFTYEGPGGSLYYDHVDEDRHYVHSEFDSDETIDNFTSSAWRAAHEAVDARSDAQGAYDAVPQQCAESHLTEVECSARLNAAHEALVAAIDVVTHRFGGHAIITGLFGIDGEHGEKSEIHPVDAFASNPCVNAEFDHGCVTPNPPDDDVWLMFVRNRGDEGFCSGDIWSAGYDDYTFRLPWRDGMQSASVDWEKTEFQWSDTESTRPDVKIVPPIFANGVSVSRDGTRSGPREAGIYVTFHLRYPTVISAGDSSASIPFVDGALHLVWTPAVGPAGALSTTSGAVASAHAVDLANAEDEDEEKDGLEVALSHLSKADRRKVLEARAHAIGMHTQLSSTKQTPQRTTGGNHSPISGPVAPAVRKNMRDAVLIKALCEATQGKPYGLPPVICTADAKGDHRR